MTRGWFRTATFGALAVALAFVALPAQAAKDRPRWDTRVLALVGKAGFPARAYVAPNGRIYEGTYENPTGGTSRRA